MFDDRYKRIGLRIGYYRRMKNLTQIELAEKVGISSTYLSRIERGMSTGTSLDVYWKIAEILEVDFETLCKSDK